MLTTEAGWSRVAPDNSVRVWTDDYSNIVSAIWRRFGKPLWPEVARQ